MLEQEDPDTSHATGAISTEEEKDAAAALLSLGEVRDDMLDDDNDNAELMPIEGQNVPVDIAPEPIHLDQMSVDKAIAGMIQSEKQTKDDMTNDQPKDQLEQPTPAPKPDNVSKSDDGPAKQETDRSTEDQDKTEPAMKGTLKTKTYTLKKKIDTKPRSFQCSECDVVKKSIKELNMHHKECHNPQICGVCRKLFKLVPRLTRHMYKHNKPKYQCDQCDYMCQFESELQTHKIVHRKNPLYKCMKANCEKWFRRKWDLTLHLQKHAGIPHDCDHNGYIFSTDTKKTVKRAPKKPLR